MYQFPCYLLALPLWISIVPRQRKVPGPVVSTGPASMDFNCTEAKKGTWSGVIYADGKRFHLFSIFFGFGGNNFEIVKLKFQKKDESKSLFYQ